jgi:Phage-related lysozyme (muraminidase)
VVEGMVWTQEEADRRLARRMIYFMTGVLKKCPRLVGEPSGRLAACTSLAYNIGLGAFRGSGVASKTLRKEWEGAANSFLLWNKAGGRVMKGLSKRRAAERKLYLTSKP